MHTYLNRKSLIAGFVLLLTACASTDESGDILSDRSVEYKRQRQASESLEVPPDLSRAGFKDALVIPEITPEVTATYSDYQAERRGASRQGAARGDAVLPETENIRMHRDGDQRWLEIQASPETVWPQVVAFWRENGILLKEEDPTIGVMRTDWLENRADIEQGTITKLLQKVVSGLYSTATRDQFRVRIEPGERPGTTDLFLTHRGMEEQAIPATTGELERTIWVPRPSDPGLEAEMLRRMMVFLGVADETARKQLARTGTERQQRSQLLKAPDGSSSLLIDQEFDRAWRLTGVALDRVGFLVEDRDRSKGVYFVRYDDPMRTEDKGFLSKLKFWKSEDKIDDKNQYQVKLEPTDRGTQVRVLNSQGDEEVSATATRILTLLQEQIR